MDTDMDTSLRDLLVHTRIPKNFATSFSSHENKRNIDIVVEAKFKRF